MAAWAPGASTALLNNGTGTYTGAVLDTYYTVVVTANAAGTVNFTYSGAEAAP